VYRWVKQWCVRARARVCVCARVWHQKIVQKQHSPFILQFRLPHAKTLFVWNCKSGLLADELMYFPSKCWQASACSLLTQTNTQHQRNKRSTSKLLQSPFYSRFTLRNNGCGERRFCLLQIVQTGSGSTQPLTQWPLQFFPRGQSSGGVTLTTQPRQVPRLKMRGAMPPSLPHSFRVLYRDFTFSPFWSTTP
jgi:hypothetical protein